MTTEQPDTLVEVTPGLTVYRVNGEWRWRQESRTIRPVTTREDVIRELEFQVQRLHLKVGVLVDALHALKSPPSGG